MQVSRLESVAQKFIQPHFNYLVRNISQFYTQDVCKFGPREMGTSDSES